MSPEYRITSITFDRDVVVMTYMQSTDVRVKGMVGVAHQIELSLEHPDYGEDAELLHRQAVKVLRNALEDFHSSEPYEPEEGDDEDDEFGGRP